MNTLGYTDLSVKECVFVFNRIIHLKYCVLQGAVGVIWSKDREMCQGMNIIAQ